MKFLIHSNSPTVSTGYGVQCRHLADLLADAGHEVAVGSTYGQQGEVGQWTSPRGHKIRIYPSGYFTNSPDVISQNAMHFFEGDPQGGIIIPLLDVWVLSKNRELAEFRVAAWAPVDHYPVPKQVLEFFHTTGAIPIAMSKFGEACLRQAGLDPLYVPLSVDTDVFKPTPIVTTGDGTSVTGHALFGVPLDAYVVGMVAMNKDPQDRKGFNEAFRAFGQFWKDHNEAVLLVHSDKLGAAGGLDLVELATHCGIPNHALIWTDQYAYRLGLPDEMMAALYSTMDVLLAPSHGEGFGVPLIEAQACGVPVIVSDFSSQSELVGSGFLVDGQLIWDQSQSASYIMPYTVNVLQALEDAYKLSAEGDTVDHRRFAIDYDYRTVFAENWVPVLNELCPPPPPLKPKMTDVDVIVPAMREGNSKRFFDSLGDGYTVHQGSLDKTYAENVNELVGRSESDWILIVGDDVEFTPGWFEAAAAVSEECDIIGTNDSEPGRVRNPDVAAGRHADHFFVRRDYINAIGSSLDGPGVTMPECYRHWFVDKEVIGLAKARGVFKFAEDCRIIHHHPGYDGDESARQADPLYKRAVSHSESDEATFMQRAPLIAMHKAGR
tara:strand:+ start:2583 stop:4400 length:1818 start_codon:yes stop_codon:yes gene_type:complete